MPAIYGQQRSNRTYTASLPMRYGEDVPTQTPVVAPSPSAVLSTAMPVVGPAATPAQRAHAAHWHMRRFYNHLRLHPSYYLAAKSVGKRVAAGDPAAKAAVQDLMTRAAAGDYAAINTCKAIGVVMKFEHMIPKGTTTGPYGLTVSGLLPAATSTAGKLLRFVLSPAAWALGVAGQAAHWGGNQFANLSRAL